MSTIQTTPELRPSHLLFLTNSNTQHTPTWTSFPSTILPRWGGKPSQQVRIQHRFPCDPSKNIKLKKSLLDSSNSTFSADEGGCPRSTTVWRCRLRDCLGPGPRVLRMRSWRLSKQQLEVSGPTSLKSRLWSAWVPFRRHFILTLGMARVGLREQTFLGSTEKKKLAKWSNWEGFCSFSTGLRRVENVGVSRGLVSAGLALVSREYPWFFHGNTVGLRHDYARARARGCKSIDRHRRCRLSVSLSCLARLDFSCPVTRDCRKDDKKWGIGDGWSACSSTNSSDSTDKSPFPQSSATVFDAELVFRTWIAILLCVRVPKVTPLSIDGCLLCEKKNHRLNSAAWVCGFSFSFSFTFVYFAQESLLFHICLFCPGKFTSLRTSLL